MAPKSISEETLKKIEIDEKGLIRQFLLKRSQ